MRLDSRLIFFVQFPRRLHNYNDCPHLMDKILSANHQSVKILNETNENLIINQIRHIGFYTNYLCYLCEVIFFIFLQQLELNILNCDAFKPEQFSAQSRCAEANR
jgi:hypothetical protein